MSMGICGGWLARGVACIAVALTFVVASGTARPSEAEAANGLFPILDCVTYDEVTDTVTARFGFSNTTGVAQQAPIEENYFDPPPEYRDQPEVFQPGTYHEVFDATFPAGFDGNGYLTWNLRGSSVTARNDPNIYCEGADTTAPDTAILEGPRGTVQRDDRDLRSLLGGRRDLPVQPRQRGLRPRRRPAGDLRCERRLPHDPGPGCRRCRQHRPDARLAQLGRRRDRPGGAGPDRARERDRRP